jgi:hypothetical protein
MTPDVTPRTTALTRMLFEEQRSENPSKWKPIGKHKRVL